MDFIPLAVATATVYAIVNLAKFLRAKDYSSVGTQVLAWVGGIAMALVFAASDFGASFEVTDGLTLGDANVWSVVLFGLGLGSSAITVADARKAIDRTDSAITPNLITGHVEPVGGAVVTPSPEG